MLHIPFPKAARLLFSLLRKFVELVIIKVEHVALFRLIFDMDLHLISCYQPLSNAAHVELVLFSITSINLKNPEPSMLKARNFTTDDLSPYERGTTQEDRIVKK